TTLQLTFSTRKRKHCQFLLANAQCLSINCKIFRAGVPVLSKIFTSAGLSQKSTVHKKAEVTLKWLPLFV
ncbi:MAG: hypothetical protein IJP90_17050, partial [Treponema sp.]|nr:hypothetical protein [Treponema sp.]